MKDSQLIFVEKLKNIDGYYHHIGVYVYKPDVLEKFIKLQPTKNEDDLKLEQMRAIDNNMNIKVVKIENNPPSVDTLADLQKIRLLFKKKILILSDAKKNNLISRFTWCLFRLSL